MPIPVAALNAFAVRVFQRCGVSDGDAKAAATVLVTTDTWGVFTHGTKALHQYARRLRAGGLKAKGRPRVEKEGPAWALLDGDSSLGMVTGIQATELAMAKAKSAGVGLVVVRNSCHFGAAGYYASYAADQGMISIAVSNDVPSVSAPGSRHAVMGSNPFGFGAPAGEGSMVLDIATAGVAGGKVAAAAQAGKSVPDTWLIDDNGRPTGDPTLFTTRKASLTPMAGHKGYGIALMIELLSGGLSGAAMRDKVGIWGLAPHNTATDHSHAFLAISPEAFLGKDAFAGRADDLFRGIRASPAVEGSHVLIPGDIEREKRRKALEHGIEFPEDVLAALRTAVKEDGGPPPDFSL